jgi:N-acyl homoserine lactone hydrolase
LVDHGFAFAGTGPRLVCNDKEKAWAFGYPGEFNGAHLKADYEGLEFETVSGDTEFLPGVTFIEAPGHTPGTMAMKVDLPETGTMIFTSDALCMGESYGPPQSRRRSSATCPPGTHQWRRSAASRRSLTPR